jgi:hypothetical protein
VSRSKKQEQLDTLSTAEIARLASRIQADYHSAIADHNQRMVKNQEFMRRWRAKAEMPAVGEEKLSNFPLPYIRWNVLTALSKEMDSLFGDDAEVVANPVGASDYRKDKKVGLYMTWRVFDSMKALNRFCVFILRKLVFGRAFAFSPWQRETYTVRGKEIVSYEGPGFEPQYPDDIIVPVEEVETIHDFSFVIRRFRCTPEDLLKGEEEGRYFGIADDFQDIVNTSWRGENREPQGEQVKLEQDDSEALSYTRPQSSDETLMVLEWYGKWRMLKDPEIDGDEKDISRRELHESQLVIRMIWEMYKVVSIQDLEELYPNMKNRRPIVESSMFKDGSYWSPGMAELLIDIEDELRANYNLGQDAGEISVGPVVFYRPAAGINPKTLKLEPRTAIPCDNPATDVRVERFVADLNFTSETEQKLLAYGERLSGQTDMSMGRQADRPNAPRTARQTDALLEEGNVRISLDTKVLQEDMGLVLSHFWDLERMFSPKSTFFRVTEDDANGLFPVQQGGADMTDEDREADYDFSIKFANSIHSREAAKQLTLARYQLDLQNPLIQHNPQALWRVTAEAHKALGDPNFADLVPEPPEPDLPVDPKVEWTRCLQGDDIHVNPGDNDELHLQRHQKDLQQATADNKADPETVPQEPIDKMKGHYLEQLQQLQHKKIMQAITEQAITAVRQLGALGALGQGTPGAVPGLQSGQAGPGGQPMVPPGIFGATPVMPQPTGNTAATNPQVYQQPRVEI